MKGRYAGVRMTIYASVLPGALSIARSAYLAGNLSAKAKGRLHILDWYHSHDRNLSLTARHFGVSRRLLRIWRNRLAREGPRGLGDRSQRPHNPRKPTISPEIIAEVVRQRKKYPAWSKYKLKPLLPPILQTSVSTIGRILKRRGLIKRKYYQFTAIDVLSKRKVMRIYKTQSSANGALFLEECIKALPFVIRTVQTDNSAPYYIYPRNPKQNTYVEISHGADEREFYQQGNIYEDFEIMRNKIAWWEDVWNNIRPHQTLDYLTPNQYLERRQISRLPTKDVITLQT